MSHYRLSQLLFAVFGATSLLLILLFYIYKDELFPDIRVGIIVVVINFICTVASALFYSWQKSRKDMNYPHDSETLEAYAQLDNDGAFDGIDNRQAIIEISAEDFWKLQQFREVITISIADKNPLRLPQVGTKAVFAPRGNKNNTIIAKVVEKNDDNIRVAPIDRPTSPGE